MYIRAGEMVKAGIWALSPTLAAYLSANGLEIRILRRYEVSTLLCCWIQDRDRPYSCVLVAEEQETPCAEIIK